MRAELLPALERDYNPRLRQALCETAEVAAAESAFLDSLVSAALGPLSDLEHGVELKLLQAQPLALQRRILRRLCQPHALALDFAQLEALREFALAGCAGRLNLPRGFAAAVLRDKSLPAASLPDSPRTPEAARLVLPGTSRSRQAFADRILERTGHSHLCIFAGSRFSNSGV